MNSKHIEVITHDAGYTVFQIEGENIIGYQRMDDRHILILRDQPSLTTTDGSEASRKIWEELRKAGGDIVEMVKDCPILLPT